MGKKYTLGGVVDNNSVQEENSSVSSTEFPSGRFKFRNTCLNSFLYEFVSIVSFYFYY